MPGLFFVFIVIGGYAAFVHGDARFQAFIENGVKGAIVFAIVRYAYVRMVEATRVRRHRERLEKLQAFAQRLPRGEITNAGFFTGGKATVTGEVEDRPFELTLRFADRPVVVYELRLRGTAQEFDAFTPRGLAWLTGAPAKIHHGVETLSHELEETLRGAIRDGFEQVTSCGGLLRAQVPFVDHELDLERLVERCRAIGRIAKLAQPVTPPKPLVQGQQRCPYCRNALAPGDRLDACVECGTTHHRECMDEARGCTVHGCAGARRRRPTRSFK